MLKKKNYKLDMMANTFSLSTLEMEAGKSMIWSKQGLHSKIQTSQGYIMRPVSQMNKNKKALAFQR